jgi:hypothetical protein
MAKRFQQPTPPQVTEYAAEIGFQLDGAAFCDFYISKGWKVGQTPMKDWQAAVRTWKRRQQAEGKLKPAVDMRERYLKEAMSTTISFQQRIRCGLQTPSGGDPKDELSRLWKGLRDKHGEKFMAELKERLKK